MPARMARVIGLLTLVAATGLTGQEQQASVKPNSRSDWSRVVRLQVNQKLKVHKDSGIVIEGRLIEANSEGVILLIEKNLTEKLRRQEIQRIGRVSRLRGALWGGAIAGSFFFALGAAKGESWGYDAGWGRGMMGSVLGSSFGAIGAAIGAAAGKEQILYEAPRSELGP